MTAKNQHGLDAEEATRGAAAVLGLTDFVFIVARLEKGPASREIGDALLAANGRGAIVQVKARHPGAGDDGANWLSKHGGKRGDRPRARAGACCWRRPPVRRCWVSLLGLQGLALRSKQPQRSCWTWT